MREDRLKEKIFKYVPNLVKIINPQNQKAQQNSSKRNMKKTTLSHIIKQMIKKQQQSSL